ncbi:MAG: NAD(P)H-hydrate dehydratase [Synergistaceae bacterium]|nr:NAD(P)H-hydrate dehydratase [Synergistaceae bacterium]
MRRYYSSSDIRESDLIASNILGAPGVVLMENAGLRASDAIISRYGAAKNFLVLCGPGNNGGDGFVVARHLDLNGRAVTVIATQLVSEYKNDAAIAAVSAEKAEIPIKCSRDLEDYDIASYISEADVVIDAMLGTGSSGKPRGEVSRLITLCSNAAHLAALDIPSGVEPDTGEVPDAAVNAEMTVTFLAEKPGLAIAPGAYHSGVSTVASIGVRQNLVLARDPLLTGYDRSDIPAIAPVVRPDIHKGSRGALLIVGGSANFRGAPVLTALSALRAGCGLVFLAIPEMLVESASALAPEAIFIPLPQRNGSIRCKTFERAISPWLDRCDALVVGPGLSRSTDALSIANYLYREWNKPILLDADALRVRYEARRENAIITPHAGEAAFILGVQPDEIERRRMASCDSLVERFGTVLLKGPHTLIADFKERRVILEGGPELAVPGSGDVLSGIIGANLAAGVSLIDAATLGVLTHAVSGGKIASSRGPNGVLAREIADCAGSGYTGG